MAEAAHIQTRKQIIGQKQESGCPSKLLPTARPCSNHTLSWVWRGAGHTTLQVKHSTLSRRTQCGISKSLRIWGHFRWHRLQSFASGSKDDLVSQVKKRQGKCHMDLTSGWSRGGFQSCSGPGCPIGGAIIHSSHRVVSAIYEALCFPLLPVSPAFEVRQPLGGFVICADCSGGRASLSSLSTPGDAGPLTRNLTSQAPAHTFSTFAPSSLALATVFSSRWAHTHHSCHSAKMSKGQAPAL